MDGHGRTIGDVRISVTDRCNFRCQYCMPADGLPWLDRDDVLTFEEITRLVGLLAEMGVGDVRLTGGEPLVRRDFPKLAAMLAALPGVDDLSLTTNGFLLERDAEALVAAGEQPGRAAQQEQDRGERQQHQRPSPAEQAADGQSSDGRVHRATR